MKAPMAQWQRLNGEFLSAATALVRFRLERQAACVRGASGDSASSQTELDRLEHAFALAASIQPAPALVMLAERFGLSGFEQNILLLCTSMELDTRIATLCAAAQDNQNRAYPTFALAMTLFDSPSWDAMSPQRPLRALRCIDIVQNGLTPLTLCPLRADERIVNFIIGMNTIDERLRPYFIPFDAMAAGASALSESQERTVSLIVAELRYCFSRKQPVVVQLAGIDRLSKELTAVECTRRLTLDLARIPHEVLPAQMGEFDSLAVLWNRETMLLPITLYIEAHDTDPGIHAEQASANQALPLNRFLQRNRSVIFLSVRDSMPDLGYSTIIFDIRKPTESEQSAAWKESLERHGFDSAASCTELSSQFNLNVPTINHVVDTALAVDLQKDRTGVWSAALRAARPRLERLAERIEVRHTWSDLVLPEQEIEQLLQITRQVRHRSRVFGEWGFAAKMSKGTGLNALFAGPSGTGKTFAAGIIAHELNLALYRIDLSSVVSKYIGETEKNLRQVFDAAEDGGAILFFDEADALFGRRSEVKDSHDRYANIEINYLLQRMESYAGLAILATNVKNALDRAFMRRLRFIVHFPFPTLEQREQIWRRIFPATTPCDTLDWQRLAQLNLAGGSISNIALNAAFMAAADGGAVTMPMVFGAAKAELRKLELPVHDTDFRYEAAIYSDDGGGRA